MQTANRLVVNGHFINQQVTGVQRYALEILSKFDDHGWGYRLSAPPEAIRSQSLRQLWVQAAMPFQIRSDELLWSPTNSGPVLHPNQVVTLHDIADQLYPEWFSKKYVSWRKLILPRLLNRVRGVITVSDFSKKTILDRFPEVQGKIKVIPNGIDHTRFYPRSLEEEDRVLSRYNLEKPFAVTVSSLDPRKNINGLINAWNHLPEKIRSSFNLVIAGGEADIFKFKLREEPDESIKFLGYVDSQYLPHVYSAADLFIYPSLFEGFGLPVLEAMACKTAVIMSDSTSLKELGGDHVLSVDTRSSEKLTESIESLLTSDNYREDIAQKGFLFSKKFDWSITAKETFNYLSSFQK